jgi:tetratricopeptide (TPR) repeat protein
VSDIAPIDPNHFVEQVEPLLEAKDLKGLLVLLQTRWTREQLEGLLSSPHTDARKVACLALGFVGATCCIPALATQLSDPDPMANEMAEHALWSIWFRASSPEANAFLAAGAAALEHRDFDKAEALFGEALRVDPDFAEAYNQRAIVHYLCERYAPSVSDCKAAVARMPCHFGAWAGMGHGYAHLGEIARALRSYKRALAINPHLKCVRQTVDELRHQQGT